MCTSNAMGTINEHQELFQYEPLGYSKTIRLARLEEPCSQRLSCQLYTFTLDSVPEFRAISYVWGEWTAENLRSVYIDGRRLQITSNLYLALLQLRQFDSATKPEFYWADQICINQSDVNERSNQVAFMDRVFEQATLVIVWLGEETMLMRSAFDGLRALAGHVVKSGGWVQFFQNSPSMKMQSIKDFCLAQQESREDADSATWQALAEFIRNEWFIRLWIFQELVLAKEAIFMCGSQTLDAQTVLSCFEAILEANHRIFILMDGKSSVDVKVQQHYNAFIELSMMRAQRLKKNGQSLVKLIAFAAHRDVKDPRDKVFALRGLAKDVDQDELLPDYSLDAGAVYKSLALFYLEKLKSLEIFGLIRPPDESITEISSTPSWVPKLSRKVRRPPMIYDAAGESAMSIEFSDENTISIRGKIVDTVTDIGGGTRKDGSSDSTMVREVMSECDRIAAQQAIPYPTGEDSVDVLWRTLIQNSDYDEDKASASLRDIYIAWRQYLDQQQFEDNVRADLDVHVFSRHVASRGIYYDFTICVTAKGYLALVPLGVRPGDQICILIGGHMPFAIRPDGAGKYFLLAQVYVHGLMEGEAMGMEEIPLVDIIFR